MQLYQPLQFLLIGLLTSLAGQTSIRQIPIFIPQDSRIIWSNQGNPAGTWSDVSIKINDHTFSVKPGYTFYNVQNLPDNRYLSVSSRTTAASQTREDRYVVFDATGDRQSSWEWSLSTDIGYPRITVDTENRFICTFPEDQRVKVVNPRGETVVDESLTPGSDWNHEKRLLTEYVPNHGLYFVGMGTADLTHPDNVYLVPCRQIEPFKIGTPVHFPLTMLRYAAFEPENWVALSGTVGNDQHKQTPRLILYDRITEEMHLFNRLPKKMIWSERHLLTITNRQIQIIYPDRKFKIEQHTFPTPVIPIVLRVTESGWVAIYAKSVTYSNGVLQYHDIYAQIQPDRGEGLEKTQIRLISDKPTTRITVSPEISPTVSIQLDDNVFQIVESF